MVIYYACYYFVWSMSALRQGLVLTIGIYYLLETIKNNKRIKFIIVIALLSLIHSSAWLILGMYVISILEFKKWHLLALVIAAIVFNFIPIKDIITQYTGSIYVIKKVAAYVDSGNSISTLLHFNSLARIGFLIFAFVMYDIYCEDNPFNKKVMNIYILSFMLYFFFKFSELTAARLAIYGKMLDILILSNMIYYLKRKDNKLVYLIMLITLLAAYFLKELNTMEFQAGLVNSNNYFTPYVNIFNYSNYNFNP